MKGISEKILVITGLLIAGIVLVFLAFLTPVPEGGADNYAHFNIARWAFKYPHLFLDHWGKPVYTIFAAPFAQFGFVAVRILNSVLGLLTGWFVWKLAGKLKLENGWFAVVLAVFTPIYFALMSTGMTEIVFSLVLVLSVYLFFSEKYNASAVVISFLFLARTEGLAFELLFLIALITKKQYRAIPLLATGFLVFSFIGLVYHYHDFWWLYNQRPYATGGPSVYGRGEWNYFLVRLPEFSGQIITGFIYAGTIVLTALWIKEKLKFNSNYFLPVLLILGPFWGYFFIHSFLWWKGETSAGLLRVMAASAPLAGIMSLYAVGFVAGFIKKKLIVTILLGLTSVAIIYTAGDYYKKLIGYDLSAEVLQRTTDWLKESGSLKHKLAMHNPYFAFSTEIDAWDTNVVQYGFSNNDSPETGLPDSTIFIWDAQFSSNEGKLPLEKIINNNYFEVVKYFEPVIPFKVNGDLDYKIIIFRKVLKTGKSNIQLLEDMKKNEIEKGIYYIEEYDFNNTVPVNNINVALIKKGKDTTNVYYDLNNVEFGPAFHVPEKVIQKEFKNKIRVSVDVLRNGTIGTNRLLLVFSAEINNKSYHYVTADLNEQINENNVWSKTECVFSVPDQLKNETVLKSYIWNLDKKNVLLDNFKLEISKQTGN